MAEPTPHWMDEPEEHDFPAAGDYLSLVMSEAEVAAVVDALRKASLVRRKAKDLLRASQLPLLPADNAHVAADLKKVAGGKRLSPRAHGAGPWRRSPPRGRRLPPRLCQLPPR